MAEATELVPAGDGCTVIIVDDRHREAYRLRQSGEGLAEIASKFGVDVRTIYRWIKCYEDQYRKALEEKPMVNLIAEELAKLDEIEFEARKLAQDARSDTHKRGYLSLTLKTITARQQLMLDVGVLQREPARIFSTINELRASQEDESLRDERSSEEIQADIIELLKYARSL